ncbi:MAG: hypothetical protein HUJ97_04235 [Bacteroidales bacterium]|nr:hypothetical protein [Bacteroidales bacterium]
MKKLVLFAGVMFAMSFASCTSNKQQEAPAVEEAAVEVVEEVAACVDSCCAAMDSCCAKGDSCCGKCDSIKAAVVAE